MKVNKTYKSLLDKSINSMLSAIEIYNKPNFNYREETFAILSINAWELLFKAYLLKLSKYKMNNIYKMEHVLKKNGEKSSRMRPFINRSGNAMTISLPESIKRLQHIGTTINPNLISSLYAIVELRDNAIHFHNEGHISKLLQELGFACIKNYMNIISLWKIEIDLSKYNFYLMPLAYVDAKIDSESILTDEESKYLSFVQEKVIKTDKEDIEFDVAIGIDVKFIKSSSFDGLTMKYGEGGVEVTMSEEDMTKKFPLSYADIKLLAAKRYSDFKYYKDFHYIMRSIKSNEKLCYGRKNNPKSKKSALTNFFNTNVWKELDKHYTKII